MYFCVFICVFAKRLTWLVCVCVSLCVRVCLCVCKSKAFDLGDVCVFLFMQCVFVCMIVSVFVFAKQKHLTWVVYVFICVYMCVYFVFSKQEHLTWVVCVCVSLYAVRSARSSIK